MMTLPPDDGMREALLNEHVIDREADIAELREKNYEILSFRDTMISEDDVLQSESNSNSWMQLYCYSKMRPGSVSGSTFTMTVAVVGAGVLSLPYAVMQSGLFLGLGTILLLEMLTKFTVNLILSVAERNQVSSFMELAFVSGGKRLKLFTTIVLGLNLFGTSVGYLVGAAQLFQLAIESLLHPAEHNIVLNQQLIVIILSFIVILPLSLLRSLSSLRFTSLIAVGCIMYMSFVIVIKYFEFVALGYAPSISYQLHNLILFETHLDRILHAFPLIVFVFTCHPYVIPIYSVLRRPTRRRMNKVVNRSLSLATLIYIFCSIFVVLTFGKATKSNFLLDNYHHDIAILLGTIGFSAALLLTVPLFVHTLRDILKEAFAPGRNHLSCVQRYLVTISIVLFLLLVALTAADIASVLRILGGTTNPILCFVLPAYFAHQNESHGSRKVILALVLAVVMSIICSASFLVHASNSQSS